MTMTPVTDKTDSVEHGSDGVERVDYDTLRKRYTADPIPNCEVCGASMRIQSAGGGNATVYGCDSHRPFDSEHYSRSRWKQYRPGDSDVLALLDRVAELEKAVGMLLHAVCHETGFAAAVRQDSGFAYPWPALDQAEQFARSILGEKP